MTDDHQRRLWEDITRHLHPVDRAYIMRKRQKENGMPELTRPPKTAREWLENVRSRGGIDGEWAHLILRRDIKQLDDVNMQAHLAGSTGDLI